MLKFTPGHRANRSAHATHKEHTVVSSATRVAAIQICRQSRHSCSIGLTEFYAVMKVRGTGLVACSFNPNSWETRDRRMVVSSWPA